MSVNDKNGLGKILKQQRINTPLTLQELSAESGVSSSHLGRIERGERFPSARILRKIAKPLNLSEDELFTLAGFLTPKDSPMAKESVSRYYDRQLDPYVARVLATEPPEIQRAVIGILSLLKSIARNPLPELPEFRDYVKERYPYLDEDTVTMIDDLLKRAGEKLTKKE